jgi:GT2 family glycosyltransferase
MCQDISVSVVVITYNGKDVALRCLESLERNTCRPIETILVDNCSTDGTIEAVHERFPGVRIIRNGSNLMLAEARNIGIREAQAEFVFLVDNDNVIDPLAIGALLELITGDPRIGMVGPVAYYLCEPGRVWSAGSRMNMTTSLTTHLVERDIAASQGTPIQVLCFPNAFMVRKSAALEVGLFDSQHYFAAFHEADFGIRLHAAGYRVLLASQAKVYHDILSAGSAKGWLRRLHFGGRGGTGAIKAYYHGRNRLLFMKQHAGRKFWIYLLYFSWPIALFYSLLALLDGQLNILAEYIKGIKDGIKVIVRQA